MPFDRFLIAPINSGLQTDLKPWLIQDDSWAQLENAYVFRGRLRKRFGSLYSGSGWPSTFMEPQFSRLRINIGITDGSGNFSQTPAAGELWLIGQQFSVANQLFTVYQANGAMLASTGSGTGTFNTATGAVAITGAAINTIVYYYTALPVMGLTQYDNFAIDNEPAIAFDPQFAYIYSGGSWNQFGPAAGSQWNGNDTNFFWAANWAGITPDQNVLFVTNFQVYPFTTSNGAIPADPIWFYNPNVTPSWGNYTNYTPSGGIGTFNYTITLADGSYLLSCRIILPFKDRLIALNTIEYNGTTTNKQQFVNRCRYTINGSPFATNSATAGGNHANASYAWLETGQTNTVTVGGATATATGQGAGFLDATTDEQIISAEFIKDRLIVYFERSTWELVYTGNQILPFRFQKINTELGADATFSVVPFDTQVLAIGNTGVHSCSGANVQRIDQKIPDEIFKINEQSTGVERIAGVRDFYVETVYWTYPDINATQYPNKVLVYNYRNGTWAMNDDCITCFGYFDQQTSTTWSSTDLAWEEDDSSWGSGPNSTNFRQVIAGNQEGFVFIISPDTAWNEAVMSLTNITASGGVLTLVIRSHTLSTFDYICLENMSGVTITDQYGNTQTIFQVATIVDANTITIGTAMNPLTLTGTYKGGGTIARVSNYNILSKQWNPYIKEGRNFYLARIDFCVDKTAAGQVTVDYYPSGSELSMLTAGGNTGFGTHAIMGTGILETAPYDPAIYPLEQVQERLWHPIYFQTDGQTIQINIYMSPAQITNPTIAFEDFVLEGLVLHCEKTSMRLQ